MHQEGQRMPERGGVPQMQHAELDALFRGVGIMPQQHIDQLAQDVERQILRHHGQQVDVAALRREASHGEGSVQVNADQAFAQD